jgi:hypothetical protein
MNKYHTWLASREYIDWKSLIREALDMFDAEIPEMLPKEQLPVSILFSILSSDENIPQDVRSVLLDLMLYCEGEETGFGPQTKIARINAIKNLL